MKIENSSAFQPCFSGVIKANVARYFQPAWDGPKAHPGLPRTAECVEAKYKEVQRRRDVKITSGLVQIAPTMRSFYTEDPDGLPVEFFDQPPLRDRVSLTTKPQWT